MRVQLESLHVSGVCDLRRGTSPHGASVAAPAVRGSEYPREGAAHTERRRRKSWERQVAGGSGAAGMTMTEWWCCDGDDDSVLCDFGHFTTSFCALVISSVKGSVTFLPPPLNSCRGDKREIRRLQSLRSRTRRRHKQSDKTQSPHSQEPRLRRCCITPCS